MDNGLWNIFDDPQVDKFSLKWASLLLEVLNSRIGRLSPYSVGLASLTNSSTVKK